MVFVAQPVLAHADCEDLQIGEGFVVLVSREDKPGCHVDQDQHWGYYPDTQDLQELCVSLIRVKIS